MLVSNQINLNVAETYTFFLYTFVVTPKENKKNIYLIDDEEFGWISRYVDRIDDEKWFYSLRH